MNLAGAPASEIVAITLVSDPVTDATLGLAYVFNGAAVAPTCTPAANVPSVTQSGIPYNVSWSQVSDPTATFTIDESTASDFSANLVSRQVSGTSAQFSHNVTATTNYYYRVRANSCGGAPGPNSATVSIVGVGSG